jgi:hypothetical protein
MRIVATLLLTLLIGPAFAQETKVPAKVSVQEAMLLQSGLKGLDGHVVIIKQNGTETGIPTSWEFSNGDLRRRIVSDLNIVESAIKIANEAQQAIFKENAAKASTRLQKTVTELEVGMPERTDYDKQTAELMQGSAAGTQDLSKIKVSELKLDKNEIPSSVLAALKPILELDK